MSGTFEAHFDTSQVTRLAADMAAAPARVDAGLHEALDKATNAVEREAKRLAPVRTGRLRASIHSQIRGLSSRVVADTPYADYVEYGTSKMSPEPYMRPAADVAADILERGVGNAGERIL